MRAITAKRVLVVVISLLSLSLVAGCARIAGVSKSSAARNGEYYPTCLVEADQALDDARMAGKDKQCPNEFNALKETVDRAYKLHLACNTEGACKMAREAAAKVKALCPPKRAANCMTLQIEFDVCKTNIKPEFNDEVAKAGNFLKKYPETTAVLEGHTDNTPITTGPDCPFKDNLALSQARAESAVNYLVEKFGIARSRLTAKGYGDTRPVADNATKEGRLKNRRIEAIIDCSLLP